MAQAFAYYEFNEASGAMEYTDNVVQAKYFNNAETFSPGFITPDDSWENYWREGQNSLLGWDTSRSASGRGAKTMGQEMANSDAFASCQVKKAFKAVCLRDPIDSNDRNEIKRIAAAFKSGGHKMKPVFAEAAAFCKGN